MDQLNILLSKIDELGRQGKDLDMIPIFEEAIAETRLRNDDGLLARILNDYGGVLRNTGQYDIAASKLQEAREIVLRVSGRYSQAYVTTLLNMGTNELDAKRLSTAREVLHEALEIAEKLSLQNIVYASVVNNLGMVYLALKEYEIAYKYQKESMHILRHCEQSRVKLAISCSNFAETCRLLGYKEEYGDLLEEAKALLKDAVGERHPLYSIVLNNLASSLYRDGKALEAKVLLEEALPVLLECYGSHSKGYTLAIKNLELITSSLAQSGAVVPNHVADDSLLELSTSPAPSGLDERFLSESYRPDSGLELSRQFLASEVYPLLKQQFPKVLPRLAAALTGKGSECLGYDDHISRDHDFEVKVLLFLEGADYQQYHLPLESALEHCRGGKAYVVPIEDFFRKYTKSVAGPNTIAEWRDIPEQFLVNAVSGKVFFDNLGTFTAIRNRILGYYPEDVRLKYLAFYCIKLAQAGQYNYPRSLERQDYVAASLALNEAITMIMSIVYALNKTFMPFYKWQYKGMETLPILGAKVHGMLYDIVQSFSSDMSNVDRIETLCEIIIEELKQQGLSNETDGFLLHHGNAIFAKIQDADLRKETPWTK